MRAAIYTSLFAEEKAAGFRLSTQSERCETYASTKSWDVVARYADDEVPITSGEIALAGLTALLEAAETEAIEVTIVSALDRFGQNIKHVLDVVIRLTSQGTHVVSCQENLDTRTPEGQWVLTVFSALAQLEGDPLVERTAAGREARGRFDGEKGGRLPMGYIRNADGTISLDPDQDRVETVCIIFDRNASGASLRAIAAELNAHEYATPHGGKKWYASSVREVLLNAKAYRGGKRGGSNANWPKILDAGS